MVGLRTFRDCASRSLLALFILGFASAGAVAKNVDTSCYQFSPDPNDQSGPPIHFVADLSDAPQREPTYSPGWGRAEFVLERESLTLSWTVTFKDLTSEPIGLHMHGPVPAEGTAPAIFDLTSENFDSPVKGQKVLSQGELASLVQNLLYVNLHTTEYPKGELRGPVQKLRPKC